MDLRIHSSSIPAEKEFVKLASHYICGNLVRKVRFVQSQLTVKQTEKSAIQSFVEYLSFFASTNIRFQVDSSRCLRQNVTIVVKDIPSKSCVDEATDHVTRNVNVHRAEVVHNEHVIFNCSPGEEPGSLFVIIQLRRLTCSSEVQCGNHLCYSFASVRSNFANFWVRKHVSLTFVSADFSMSCR